MAIKLSSRDESGQIVTVDYPGTASPDAGVQGDAAAAGGTGAPGAPPEPPAGAGESSPASPAAPTTPASGEGAGDTETDDLSDIPEDAPITKSAFNKRIDRLTARHRSAERALEAERQQHQVRQAQLEAQLGLVTRLLQGQAPTPPEPPQTPQGPPQPEAFTSEAEWREADRRYTVETARRELADAQQQERQQSQAQQFHQHLLQRVETFKQTHPDYDAVIGAGFVGKVAPHVDQAVTLLPDGPALAYALAQQPDLLQRLNTLPPPLVLWELGRLSPAPASTPLDPRPGQAPPAAAPVTTPNGAAPPAPAPPAPALPPPPTPLSGSGQGVPTFTPAEASQAELRKRWNAGWRPTARDFGR